MFARPLIDSVEFARHGKELRGEVAVSGLSRLEDILADQDGVLAYTVRGYREGDNDMLELSLEGKLVLSCQRCLGNLNHPVSMISRYRLLPADMLEAAEENDDDEVDAIEASQRLDVLSLIEDELLLGLPFAPKHSEGECGPAAGNLQQKANPFAVLAGLKK